MNSLQEIYGFMLTALIAGEAILLSSYGSVYSAFSSYRTAGGFKVSLFKKLIFICNVITVILVICAVASVYILYQLWTIVDVNIPIFVFLIVGFIVVALPVPAVVISWDMK